MEGCISCSSQSYSFETFQEYLLIIKTDIVKILLIAPLK